MSHLPAITVSSLDLERLYQLLDQLPADSFASAVALENELIRAQVLEPYEMPADVVTMRSIVRFAIHPAGKEFELMLCYPDEMDDNPNKISILAPVGAALLGLSVGQQIEWPAPGGRQVSVRITAVVWQPERVGLLAL
jgi:regulator of nucleoside diphosphate kinase